MSYRLDVPRPRILGIAFTVRGVAMATLVCIVGTAIAVLMEARFVAVLFGFALMVVLLCGYLAWMAYRTWLQNPRAFVVSEHALVIEGPEPVEFPWSEVTNVTLIEPMFLQIHHAGRCAQYTVLNIAPNDVAALLDAIRSRL